MRHNLEEVADDLSDADLKAFHRLVQDMALSAYPNPDRIGCPGHAALEEVASLPLSSRHELSQTHINRCSECLRELLEIRRRNNMQKQRLRRKRWILTACAASVILAAGITLIVRRQTTSAPPAQIQRQPSATPAVETARLDLSDQTGLRTDDRGRKTEVPHQLPGRRLSLSVTLPFASPPGPYQFGLFRLDQTALATTAGNAEVSQGATILSVQVDLSAYPPGQYLVGVKRASGDWSLHELTIR